ncbi:hypothetical protein PAAG_11940 [Paracoccidioides lutzii Pb01]|uniref:Uncharacterized protein n=1 Tax=Paracoccidioides lutzii (strain ATCC MYA-826 / Pb01) TaxID=502779 RepID=A0A0A2V4S2_PARBA|nr:hypothetical protein PAAG_11940 [Paracoccidioides lutzii Pb01]KGQ01362.1 hypothetical protein PAAG_11940 [Paracoccidioides lutzii Pb01]
MKLRSSKAFRWEVLKQQRDVLLKRNPNLACDGCLRKSRLLPAVFALFTKEEFDLHAEEGKKHHRSRTNAEIISRSRDATGGRDGGPGGVRDS